MVLSSLAQVLPFVFVTNASLSPDIPDPIVPPIALEAPEGLHEERKRFLVRTFRRIFQLENPQIDLGAGASKEAADHLLPYGVLLNRDEPCATDVADRQMERFGRVAGYDSFHWAWFPENKTLRDTSYKMFVITRIKLGDVRSYLTDESFIQEVARELAEGAGYDGYLSGRDIEFSRTECAGFDLYQIELSDTRG